MSTADTKINIRIDKKTKEKAQKTLNKLGLDLSSGVKLFLHAVVRDKAIPFEIRTENGYTVTEEIRMIRETKAAIEEYRNNPNVALASGKEVIDSILG